MNRLSSSPRSDTPSPKPFSFAPIAVAVAAVLSVAASPVAFAADVVQTPFDFPDDDAEVAKAQITLNLDQISKAGDFEWRTRSGALVTVDCGDADSARTPVTWWSSDSNRMYETSGNPQGFSGTQHAEFTVTNDSGAFNLGWDFSFDKIQPGNPEYRPYGPAIANFRLEEIDNDSPDRYLKHFLFKSAEAGKPFSVITHNSKVHVTNAGGSESMLGLSVSNKRGWMTFTEETYLVSDFQFLYGDEQAPDSGTAGEYVAAGVVAGFGANFNDDVGGGRLYDSIFDIGPNGQVSFKDKVEQDIGKYGLIKFKQRSTVSVTALPAQNEKDGRLNEVFGVFTNEGGTVDFQKGGDILVKGRDNHHLVSALTSASTLGILDPLKSGKITFKAGTGVNRIWGWSDNYNYEDGAPVTVGYDPETGAQKELFGQDGVLDDAAFENMKGQIEDYLEIATGGNDIVSTDQHLRGSILAANDSVISITDNIENNGWLDIRGDVIAAVKNGEDAGSNTFVSQTGSSTSETHANYMNGTVTRATVNLTLSHENSTLVGNVYERHRVGNEEAVVKSTDAVRDQQSFDAWHNDQYKEESKTLGGTVNLSISGGAVWYPTKDWKGWNYDILYQNFFNETGNNEYGTVNDTYAYLDTSDQYNLNVKEGDGYKLVNNMIMGSTDPINEDKINDLDLLDRYRDKEGNLTEYPDSIRVAGEKPRDDQGHQTYTTVDAGVYHLKLDGGTVDLSYLRRDFQMSTAQEDLGVIRPGEAIEVEDVNGNGIKKFRVQALNGSSGNFRIYAKDATHHDLVIVDEMRDAQNVKHEGKSFDLNLVLWNDGIGDEHKLTVDPNNPLSYIQVARVPDSVNVTAESYGEGRTTFTAYRVVKDEKTMVDGVSKYVDGSITYDQGLDWHEQNVNWFITGEAENRKDMAVIGTTELAANLGYLMATTMETLRDRRGEMTFNGTKEDGWWVRYTHDRFGLEGFTAETDGFQFGYEWMKPEEGGRLFRGAALDVAQGDVDYDRLSGESEADRYRLSAYQTYMGDNGVYYDAVLRAGWYDAETNVAYTRYNGTVYDMKGNFDYWAAAASFEAGHRFESQSAWWIEPEVQLQYTYITDYDYKTNHGIRIDTDDTQSLIGRFGVRMGKVLSSDAGRHMSVWAGADVFHEWLGDRDGTMKGVDETVRYDISGDDTWWDAVFGMTWETGPDSRVFAAAKHDFGGDKENTWTVNVGATWNF